MMRGPSSGLLVLAALPVAAALRVHGAHKTAVEDFRRMCGGGAPPADLVERGLECDPEIPRYDMDEWIEKNGDVAPDHPAVFVNTHTKESEVFPSMESFLEQHGDHIVTALPEYATSGSFLKHPRAAGKITASFRDLMNSWNDTFVYFSDFKCAKDSLCEQSAKRFGIPKLFQTHSTHSKNFLVGGPDSGLPFHKHGMTWQGLSMGRKAWYLLPPGSMSEEMHDATGPYIFPMRAYHPVMQKLKLGSRPLYCVQNAGQVLFVPEYWWHATMNLDRYQVAYGEKPIKHFQNRSAELDRLMAHFPVQPFDSAGFSCKEAGGKNQDENPIPYSLPVRQGYAKKVCNTSGLDNPAYGVEEPLSRMRSLAGSEQMRCGLAETAAFAHCLMSQFLRDLPKNCSTRASPDAMTLLQRDAQERSLKWQRQARELSPQLFEREPSICAKSMLERAEEKQSH